MGNNLYFPKVFLLNKHNNGKELVLPYQSYNINDANRDLELGKKACKTQCRTVSIVKNYDKTCKKIKMFINTNLLSKRFDERPRKRLKIR